MKFDSHDINKEIFIVAEIGNNHEGNINIAKELIKQASIAKVNAVKFQTFIPENYVTSSDIKRINMLKKFQLTKKEIISLSDFAKSLGLIFFSTPFDIESAIFLDKIQSIFKISSGDNNFAQLVNKVFEFKKPTIISTGLADLKLLEELYNNWFSENPNLPISFLHCVTSYPVLDTQANMNRINKLKLKFPKAIIGYSDHTIGLESACLAVSMGARIIEKHFTIDKNFSEFRDHQLSADPIELKDLVEKIRKIEMMMSDEANQGSKDEESNRIAVRRSIAASRKINAKKVINKEDLTWLRPGTGFKPGEENYLIGRSTSKEIKKGEIILPEMLQE